ncbi:MAG: hypothetical protein HYS22_08175 [Deltaproteobacteria bacterium]|nr:hypothetical protein [Deltaproteobacteria bacterium]
MKRTKILLLFLPFLFVIGFVACSGGGKEEEKKGSEETGPAKEEKDPATGEDSFKYLGLLSFTETDQVPENRSDILVGVFFSDATAAKENRAAFLASKGMVDVTIQSYEDHFKFLEENGAKVEMVPGMPSECRKVDMTELIKKTSSPPSTKTSLPEQLDAGLLMVNGFKTGILDFQFGVPPGYQSLPPPLNSQKLYYTEKLHMEKTVPAGVSGITKNHYYNMKEGMDLFAGGEEIHIQGTGLPEGIPAFEATMTAPPELRILSPKPAPGGYSSGPRSNPVTLQWSNPMPGKKVFLKVVLSSALSIDCFEMADSGLLIIPASVIQLVLTDDPTLPFPGDPARGSIMRIDLSRFEMKIVETPPLRLIVSVTGGGRAEYYVK